MANSKKDKDLFDDLDKKLVIEKKDLPDVQSYIPEYSLQKNAISRAYYKISATGKKLLTMALAGNSLKKQNKYYQSSFLIEDFKKTMLIKKGGTTGAIITNAVEELAGLTINFHLNEFRNFIPLFAGIQYDTKRNAVNFIFNPLVNEILKDEKGKTKLEIEECGLLKSTYAMRYYEYFKSYAGFASKNGNDEDTYFVYLSYDECRKLCRLSADQYTDDSNFRNRIIQRPIAEIKEKITSFKILKEEPKKENGKIVGIEYTIKNMDPDRENIFGRFQTIYKTKLCPENYTFHKLVKKEKELFMTGLKQCAIKHNVEINEEFMNDESKKDFINMIALDAYSIFEKLYEEKQRMLEEQSIEPIAEEKI